MRAPSKCPGCGTKLQPDWESCPNCPMSFLDAPPEKGALQNDTFRSVGMPILFFVGFAFFIWSLGQYLWRTAEEGIKTVPGGFKPTVAGTSSQGGGFVPQAPVRDVPPEAEAPTEPAEAVGPGTISILPSEAPKAKIVREWKMRGTVYDLITLQPVPSAQLTFTDNDTNARALIQADSLGRYRAILPSLDGRGYVTPEDVQAVFAETIGHRLCYQPVFEMRRQEISGRLMAAILANVAAP